MINILLNKKTKTEVVLVFENKLPEEVKALKKLNYLVGNQEKFILIYKLKETE